jgi:hypothetical protein
VTAVTQVDLPVSLSAFGCEPREATATVVEQTPPERMGRVLTGLGMFWGLALLGLFIPVAHFILVPTFFVAGIVVAVKRSREDRRLLAVCGACPRCGAQQTFKGGGRFASGRTLDCPACHGTFTVAEPGAPA